MDRFNDWRHNLLCKEAQDALKRAAMTEPGSNRVNVTKAIEEAITKAKRLNPERYADKR